MHISVLIPAHHRVPLSLLKWTLEGYLGQELSDGHTVEIHVGIDGAPEEVVGSSESAVLGEVAATTHFLPRMGAAGVRNFLMGKAEGELIVFGNADARPGAGMLEVHAQTFLGLPGKGRGCLVLGSAPWEMPERPTVFDVLLAETPMIFFYSKLVAGEWYDWRHAWTLNLSARADDLRACGGFHEELRPVYYEDLAFGHRMLGPTRAGVLYRPEARVVHRHPTTLGQYLDREELLGLMAPVLGRVVPEAFGALFGVKEAGLLVRDFEIWTGLDSTMHRWIYQRLQEWAGMAAEALPRDAGERSRVLNTIYQMHVPLKRLAFRLGYLRGIELVRDEQWQERVPAGLWRKVVEA